MSTRAIERAWLLAGISGLVVGVNLASGGEAIQRRWDQVGSVLEVIETINATARCQIARLGACELPRARPSRSRGRCGAY